MKPDLHASVPAELPEPELQQQPTAPDVHKKPKPTRGRPRQKGEWLKRPLVPRVPVNPARDPCSIHQWAIVQHKPRVWQCAVCTELYQGPQR
jgi:hypothetical protein